MFLNYFLNFFKDLTKFVKTKVNKLKKIYFIRRLILVTKKTKLTTC